MYLFVKYALIWQIPGTDKFAKVIDFLCRQLHRETLVNVLWCCFLVLIIGFGFQTNLLFIILQFVYVNSAFSPNPDELVVDLYNVSCYKGIIIFLKVFSLLTLFFGGVDRCLPFQCLTSSCFAFLWFSV